MRARLFLALIICLVVGISFVGGGVRAESTNTAAVKKLNFVFLHGAAGNASDMQLLSDAIEKQSPDYFSLYAQSHPGVSVELDYLLRSYPNNVDLLTWATNIADAINTHFSGRNDLILVGHSMGGKAALFAVAHNIGGIANRVAAVVTINTPVKALNDYFIAGNGSASNYCSLRWLSTDVGVCSSLGNYDSSSDGAIVAASKHWLAFISSENAPLSPQFDYGGLDGYPRNMDDGLVPIDAQYTDAADAVYYGQYIHGAIETQSNVAQFIADRILRYIFGGVMMCSSPTGRSGTFEHKAGILPIKYEWNDTFGDVQGGNGTILHQNSSWIHNQSWEDVVGGDCPPGYVRSQYGIDVSGTLPFVDKVKKQSWFSDSATDGRLFIASQAFARTHVKIEWGYTQHQLLPDGVSRERYEIEVTAGTSEAGVSNAAWISEDQRDTRIVVQSQAEGPFRWFDAEWKIFQLKPVQRNIIDSIQTS
ncbi:MAG TPA: alpha/beta hydrolase [Dehalococcoidales bacterium]|nr:alpha/beta hydrolase [Dehalococcoidales bacterium]